MDSIQTMLDFREMTASYRSAPTLVGTPMTDLFFTNAKPANSDEVQIFKVGRGNTPAPGNTRGAAPKRLTAPAASREQYALFHSFNEMSVNEQSLRFLEASDQMIREQGMEWVNATLEEFGRQQRLFREVVVGCVMNYGRVNLAADGTILLPSVNATSGALTDNASTQLSADFGVANSHRGRCSLGGGSYVFSGAWDTDSTDIIAELDLLRDTALKGGSEAPTTVYLNPLRKQKLINNTKFKAWATLNNVSNEAVLSRNEFSNVWGWNFKFLEGYWTDSTGTQNPIIPVRQAIIVPADGPWKRCFEGLQMVPTNVGIVSDLAQALKQRAKVYGMFSFAQMNVTPLIQVMLYMGDNFGMGFANANAPWMPTVFSA